MENKYFMVVTYKDLTQKTEKTSNICSLLNAASIYWEDLDCFMITIFDYQAERDILHLERP